MFGSNQSDREDSRRGTTSTVDAPGRSGHGVLLAIKIRMPVLALVIAIVYPSYSSLDIGHDYKHNVVLIMLGEFEFLILSAAAYLGEEAYGAAMREVIETKGGHTCSLGALYITLDRLEAKGLVETWMSAPTQQRGGRAKRMVRVTGEGIRAAREFYQAVMRISSGTIWGESRCSRMPGDPA